MIPLQGPPGQGSFVPPTRWLSVVLHDVAPVHWRSCLRIIDAATALAASHGAVLRLSLLVVPCMHGQPAPPTFVAWLRRLARQGHEIVLHGWRHLDDAAEAPVQGWRDHLVRRVYTAGEGEFAALGAHEAALRIAKGRAWLQAHGLQAHGFVAPAWLMSGASLAAVSSAGFAYTCTLTRLISLPGGQWLQARSLVFSTRSAWRRAASVVWNRWQARRQRGAPLLRLELHPGDAEHAAVRNCWLAVLDEALADRQPVTLAVAAARLLSAPVGRVGPVGARQPRARMPAPPAAVPSTRPASAAVWSA